MGPARLSRGRRGAEALLSKIGEIGRYNDRVFLPSIMAFSVVLALPASAPQAPARSAALTAAQALVARVAPRVEALRGLKFKRPVVVALADAKTARAHFSARTERFSTTERARVENVVFGHLGLLPPGTTLDVVTPEVEAASGF